MQKALFLDRDGVINFDKGYVYKIDDFEFVPGIFKFCRHYMGLGFVIVVITNQAGIARKYYTEQDFHKLDLWMISQFQKHNVDILKTYFCPHHPNFTGKCKCRKPEPGMILTAAKELNIDLSRSVLIGNKNSDIEAGIKAGIAKNLLVRSNSLEFIESGSYCLSGGN